MPPPLPAAPAAASTEGARVPPMPPALPKPPDGPFRVGIYDKPVADDAVREVADAPVEEAAASGTAEAREEEAGPAESGDPMADAAAAEAAAAAEMTEQDDDPTTPAEDARDVKAKYPDNKPKYKASALDPVDMAKGAIKSFDNLTKFLFKLGVRKHMSRAEMEQACREMDFSEEQIEWAASDLADLLIDYRKTIKVEHRVALSSGIPGGQRIIDIIDRVMTVRNSDDKPAPAASGAYRVNNTPAHLRTVEVPK